MTSPSRREKVHGKHPTQKPLSLMGRLILACTEEGDVVLDAFNGSCTNGVADIETKRKYIGIESESSYVALSKKRFEASKRKAGIK